MMRVWSHRPPFLYLALFFAAYVAGAGFATALGIVPGTNVSIWPPGGVFIATLGVSALSALIAVAISRQHQQALRTLHDRERELQQLIDAVPVMIWNVTREGRPSYVNKRFTDITGATLEDITAPDGSFSLSVIHPDDKVATAEMIGRSFKTGVPYVIQYRQLRRDGSYRWTETRAEALRDESGNVLQWYGTSVDIHDLVTAQEAVRQSEQQLQQLVDAVPASIWCTTREGAPSFRNKRHSDVTGAALRNVNAPAGYSSPLATMAHPDDRVAAEQIRARAFETGSTYVVRYRQIRSDGSYRWTETRAEPFRDKSGEILQWYGVSVDIHDLVVAQEALRERERELSQLVDMVPVLIRRLTPEGEPTFFNKRLMDFFGLEDVADLDRPGMSRLAATIQNLVHADDATILLETARRAFAAGEPFSTKYRMRRADGAYRWMDTRVEPLRNQSGAIVQWYVVSLDIDDEMRAQEALRRSERELQQLVDAMPVHVWSWTPDGRLAYVNKRSLEELGLPGANLEDCARVAQALVHPEDAPEVLRTSANCLKTGDVFTMRYRRRWKDGNYRWIEARCEPLRDRDGTIVHWYQVSIDIEDQMRAEAAIRQSERRLQQMIDAVPVYILSFTAEGQPTYINKRYQDYLGLTVPHFDSLQEQQRAIIHPEDFAEMYGTLSNCFQTGAPFVMRYRRRGKDGVYRWTEGRAEPLRDQDGAIVQWYAVSLDIDDEKRAQEALQQASDKLAKATQAASLAELSASIAHEVNQPLAAIVANSHACQRWLSAEPANIERAKITVERIIRDANSAADVVARIRALFRQSVEPRSSMPLSGAIAEARSLMAEEAGRRRVRMDIDVESDLPLVAFDRVQIQQVLINLIRNGFDAMDSAPDDRVLGLRARRDGSSIQIEIRDRGQGIEFPDKMFEPFFTTKQDGMGMGLAICRSIVESHGGRLWAESNEPRGATFIFTLPIELKSAA